MRRWELVADGSAKFWEVDRDGVAVTVRFGRLGTAGQTKTKELASEEAARSHVAKLVAEKEKKGYRPAGAEVAAHAVSSAASPQQPTEVVAQAVSSATATQPATEMAGHSAATPVERPDEAPAQADSPVVASTQQPADVPTEAVPSTTASAQPPTEVAAHTLSPAAPAQARAEAPTEAAPPATTPAQPPTEVVTHTLSPAAPAPAPAEAAPPTTTPAHPPTEAPTQADSTPAHPPLTSPPAPAPPAALSPQQEDTWVLPEEWLSKAMRRRDAHPLPDFAVDPTRAQHVRDQIARHGEKIAEVLEHPASQDTLVHALRTHLAGTPDPVGAAALAKVAAPDDSPVHWWIEDFGLPFAAAAAVHHPSVHVHHYRDGRTGEWSGHSLRWGPPRHYGDDVASARALVEVRTALAVADQETYDAVAGAVEPFTGDAFSLAARAFLVPTRHDWFEEANAAEWAPFWMVLCSASTLDHLDGLRVGHVIWSPVGLATALHVHGPALTRRLDADLRAKVDWDGDSRKRGLHALAVLPTDEAFLLLLNRIRERYVRPALAAAMAAYPARAARLLAARAGDDAEARALLRVHLLAHPGLPLPQGVTPPETVPDAPVDAVPRVLAVPPWEHRRPQPKPVVVKDVPVPAGHIAWLPGEHEEWLQLSSRRYVVARDWPALVARGRARHDYDHLLFDMGPEELARPLLADWVPGDSWGCEDWGRHVAARFGLEANAPMARLAAAHPQTAGAVLLPYATAEAAAVVADWLVRLKTVRAVAVSWLSRHREAAARLLLPAALGPAGPARRNAEAALRHLHLHIGVDVVAVAAGISAAVEAGARTLIDVDSLDVLPAKLPPVDWADPRLLPQVLLADGSGALSAAAARNLLTTAALSKPDATYPGLPLAVEGLDRASLAEFGWAVFCRWQDLEAPAKDGWALTALGWFGDDETVRRLAPLIRAWPGESQHARAVTGLDVLAQIGSEAALTALNGIAERVKFKGLKTRAQEKVAGIAATLGLSRDQLSDRLVPRLGLDDAATLVVDYGPRQFTVGFDEQLKPYVLDPDGKRRKDLPKPGAKDDQDLAPAEHKRFTALKKDVRGLATAQVHRLERAMVEQRGWTAEEFHTVLAGHPLLWHLVRRLVWVTDDGLSFRAAEDRTLADANDDEVTLPADATVRLAHPVALAGALEAWGEVFADYEILQPFPQLGRPVHAFAPGEDLVPQLQKYVGRDMPVGKLLGLTTRGWERCQPQDNGTEPWMTRPLPAGGALVACVDPGITVGVVDMFPEMKFTSLWFSPTGEGAWFPPRSGSPDTFEVDPVTASELLAELESLHA
ncbi:DUF4132 domain-containing protein [Lentzea sp. NPDC060358]|uniref:DUF4132 domain-containing protein n=1 Tax=Lentzea sp. NPDC060358 TaxID=3347103 RepID=UPI0036664076